MSHIVEIAKELDNSQSERIHVLFEDESLYNIIELDTSKPITVLAQQIVDASSFVLGIYTSYLILPKLEYKEDGYELFSIMSSILACCTKYKYTIALYAIKALIAIKYNCNWDIQTKHIHEFKHNIENRLIMSNNELVKYLGKLELEEA